MSSLPTTVNSIEPFTTSKAIVRPEPEMVPKPLPLPPKIVVEAFDEFD